MIRGSRIKSDFKKRLVMVFTVCIYGYAGIAVAANGLSSDAATIGITRLSPTNLPPTFRRLFDWPSDSELSGTNRLSDSSPDARDVKADAVNWLESVVDQTWLSSNSLQTVFLRSEFENRDVVRTKWISTNGSRFEVSQTRSLFTLKMTPIQSNTDNGKLIDVDQVRTLLADILQSNASIIGSNGTITFDDVKKAALFYSINTARITHEQGGLEIFGDPRDMSVEDEAFHVGSVRMRKPIPATNETWFGKLRSLDYWFCQLHWWTDGKCIGVYCFKASGGPIVPAASYMYDTNWFGNGSLNQ